jgi:hypothetical protein
MGWRASVFHASLVVTMLWHIGVAAATTPATSAASAGDRATVILVVGAGGEPEYDRIFQEWSDRWAKAAEPGQTRVIRIGGDAASATAIDFATTAPATSPVTDKDRLQQVLAAESREQNQPLWLVLIGHGTSDGKETKFNLRGPDVSDLELAEWLRPTRRPLAVIDCSSASSPFLNRLSSKGRIVITATRSGSEIQFSRFGDYLSASIADPAADLDKDGQTSLLEAFLAASHRVDEFYKQAGRLVTEHALLDDNGDGLGITADFFQGFRATRNAKGGAALDGPRANQWFLVRSATEQAIPEGLRARRDQLELAIETLRQKKASLSESVYYEQLDPLLLQLARLYHEIDTDRTTPPGTQPANQVSQPQ